MPPRVRSVEYARSFEAIETAPGQYEHVVHDGTGDPLGSVSAIGRAPDVVARLREFLGPVPVHETDMPPLELLGAHVLVGNVIGVDWPKAHPDDQLPLCVRFHLADGRVISIAASLLLHVDRVEVLVYASRADADDDVRELQRR